MTETMTSAGVARPPGLGKADPNLVVVGIGERRTSKLSTERLITFSLGSCIGVVLYDAQLHVAGLIHCLLPVSRNDPERAARQPELFVDTGLAALLDSMFRYGCERSRVVAYLAGASNVMDTGGVFRISERNLAVARMLLEKNSIPVVAERVGGTEARTLYVDVGTGAVHVRVGREEIRL